MTDPETVSGPDDPSASTGDRALDAEIDSLIAHAGQTRHRDELVRLFVAALHASEIDHARDDVDLAAAALEEMARAFSIFSPYRHRRKVTIFGSARTRPDEPTYQLAGGVAEALADRGWMVVTGAGPGIMAAATEGAGADMSMGVSIRLPFEPEEHDVLHHERHVRMRYFFTRKLMLVKESQGFVSLAGGFGTLDETFELLTLQQTGRADPVPIVLLDAASAPFWSRLDGFLRDTMVPLGVISPDDVERYLLTDDATAAADHIEAFYADYHSIRYVDDLVVMRRHRPIDPAELPDLDARFADMLADGSHFMVIDPTPDELDDDDAVELCRLAWRPSDRHHGSLAALMDHLDRL